jgi:3-hydroxyacyl-[acyl-carrier-protein] dehydratase
MSGAPAEPSVGVLDRVAIEALLPHRAPMLLVDQVELTLGDDGQPLAIGQYTVKGDEFFLQGHFPGNPVVPGVMLCEMMGQSACVLLGDAAAGKTPFFTGMDKVRFRKPVLPGDTVVFKVSLTRAKAPFYFVSGQGLVAGKLRVSAELSFALVG